MRTQHRPTPAARRYGRLVAAVTAASLLLSGMTLLAVVPAAVATTTAARELGGRADPLGRLLARPPTRSVLRAADGSVLATLHGDQDRKVVGDPPDGGPVPGAARSRPPRAATIPPAHGAATLGPPSLLSGSAPGLAAPVEQAQGSSPTTQASWPGGISTTWPGSRSRVEPSSSWTYSRPDST